MSYEEIDFTDAEMLRTKAEEKLNKNHSKNSAIEGKPDLNKLIHELQVHQIELEMQNEELRKAYDISESALRKYVMVFELSMMGYFILDPDGTICELNFTGADMLGDRRFSLIDSNFKLFVSEDSRVVFNNFLTKVYTNNTKESCEVVLGYDKKTLGPVYMEGVITEDEQKCLLSVVDISRFKLRQNS